MCHLSLTDYAMLQYGVHSVAYACLALALSTLRTRGPSSRKPFRALVYTARTLETMLVQNRITL